jgi:hypothetical protein
MFAVRGGGIYFECGRLPLHIGGCALRTFATEGTGKLAFIIRVSVRVVLSPRNRYVCESVVNQQLTFLGVHVD